MFIYFLAAAATALVVIVVIVVVVCVYSGKCRSLHIRRSQDNNRGSILSRIWALSSAFPGCVCTGTSLSTEAHCWSLVISFSITLSSSYRIT